MKNVLIPIFTYIAIVFIGLLFLFGVVFSRIIYAIAFIPYLLWEFKILTYKTYKTFLDDYLK